jgi:hypothetical protein
VAPGHQEPGAEEGTKEEKSRVADKSYKKKAKIEANFCQIRPWQGKSWQKGRKRKAMGTYFPPKTGLLENLDKNKPKLWHNSTKFVPEKKKESAMGKWGGKERLTEREKTDQNKYEFKKKLKKRPQK